MQYISESCDFCDDYGVCSSTPCPHHPLINGVVKDYYDAEKRGEWWGDELCDEEMERLAKRSDEEIKRDALKAMEEEAKGQAELRSYVLDKTRKFHCEQVKGKWQLKHKFNSKCRDFTLPGGCWAGEEGICRFIHPGEEKIYDFKGQKVLKLIEGSAPRSFPTNNATFYSTRPISTSPRNAVTPSKDVTMTDSW
jgi:hypothetical protein